MTEEVRKLAAHRIARAQNTFQEGAALLEKGFLVGAVNRFYYASFYAARALLATKKLDASKHSGIIALFHEHFVRTGLVNPATAKALSRSFEQRQDTDYEDFVMVKTEEVKILQGQVKDFIDVCSKILK